MKNARFWHWNREEWCKITLRPGQCIEWYESCPTDEGWTERSFLWEYDGQFVYCSSQTRGRDCDGLHEYHFQSRCHVERLRMVDQYANLLQQHEWSETAPVQSEIDCTKGYFTPAWEKVRAGQRDYAAERAGY